MKRIWCLFIAFIMLSACENTNNKSNKAIDTATRTTAAAIYEGLPFVGKRSFETMHAMSGTGTPHWMVEIKCDSDVIFSYIQHDMSEERDVEASYNAGKFEKVMKSVFNDNWVKETRYYEITKNKVYQTDSTGARLKSEDCCTGDNYEEGANCPCEGELYE